MDHSVEQENMEIETQVAKLHVRLGNLEKAAAHVQQPVRGAGKYVSGDAPICKVDLSTKPVKTSTTRVGPSIEQTTEISPREDD